MKIFIRFSIRFFFFQISIGSVHTHSRVIIRRLTKVSTMSRSLFGQESQLLCSIDHPNLANILYKTLDGLALISEYTELGDLCLLMRRIIENDMNARLEYVYSIKRTFLFTLKSFLVIMQCYL